MNIYVGNLSHSTDEQGLRQAFQSHGEVTKANVITDKFSGESRGFGFVEMPTREEAMAAISAMNGFELDGRELNVNEAKPRTDNRGGGGYGGNRGGGGGRGGRW